MSDDFDYEELPENTPISFSMAAGAIAGIMEHTVMFPVDAIKTRMQVAGASDIYRGIAHSLSQVSSTEGSRALWRGVMSVVAGAGPAHAVHFAVYEQVSKLNNLQDKTAVPSPIISACAGACATISSDALMTPFDVIKQRMQLNVGNNSLLQTAKKIFKNEGLHAFYVSYPITLLMNVPFTVINFTVYDRVSHILNKRKKHDPLTHCLSGGVAGATAAAVSTPFDVIKTLLQTRGCSQDETAKKLSSVREAALYIYKRHGFSGFLRGVKPRILANMPSTAICWTVYETAKYYITVMNPSA